MGAAPAAATIASSAPVDEAQSVVVLEKDICDLVQVLEMLPARGWVRSLWRRRRRRCAVDDQTTLKPDNCLVLDGTIGMTLMILTMIIITLIVVATLLNRFTTSGPCAGEYPVE